VRSAMRLPPKEPLRDDVPPDDLLLVVRGGESSLADAVLERTTGDCWGRHGFFGVSVFGAPEDDLVALSRAVRAIGRRRMLRVTRCGDLRAAGLEVMPTFSNPAHYSVVLPDVSTRTFGALRACFSAPQPNPGYEPDR
jgi:hypothetical protein